MTLLAMSAAVPLALASSPAFASSAPVTSPHAAAVKAKSRIMHPGSTAAHVTTPRVSLGAPVQPSHLKVAHVCAEHAPTGIATCFAMRQTNNVEPARIKPQAITPDATPNGYGPSDLQAAYSLPSATKGSGQTIGIVDAYDDPNAESDLAAYRSQYGLPACTTANGCFTKVGQNGSTSSLPAANTGWAGEISLDLDTVSAVCPNCHIVLVEASSASMANLGASVNTAVSMGAKYVSNSYGGSISSGDASTDSQYYKHSGVFITASTGDSDYGAEYPATSAYVTAVGGTSLTRDSSTSRGWSESVWHTSSTEGGSSGCSTYIAKPAFQSNVTTGCSGRAEADVSMDADPATGVAVYQTYGGSGWSVYGGTSASSPMYAATAALASAAGTTPYGNDLSYSHPGDLNDVTQGNNGTCSPSVLCTAGVGWDGPTGNGTPEGLAMFGAGSTGTVAVTNPGSKSSQVNTPVSLQMAASGGTAPYTWSASGLPTGLSISSSGLITGTPTTAATSSVTVTATDAAGAKGSVTFSWAVTSTTPPPSGCSGNVLKNGGFEQGSTGWTASNDQIIGQWAPYETPRSGSYDAWLDGYGQSHTDTLAQSVTIPAGCKATLTYYLHVDSSEGTYYPYDTFAVTAGSKTVSTASNENQGSGYVKHTVNLSAFAGQTVKLKFTGTEDSSLQTSFVVDDGSVTLS
ncbi:hypothetical protein FGL98_04215 [Leekyejoonella antrihumi]|uniref:Peptidase S53 domain-containing protein n=2 Tax=Leekyejoonella antrihumi TaxID=1660198 RepID=A0A563E6X7_9MICO|nr:hypothetical protein FGL98_04215 [Leekyejoonella antrihumi]